MTTTLRSTTYVRTKSTRMDLKRRVTTFTDDVDKAAIKAASVATKATQERLKTKVGSGGPVRPPAPWRPGRGGHSLRNLAWKVRDGAVEIDTTPLRKDLPYWMAQEVGTNRGAQVMRPFGKTAYIRVKKQRGRRIPNSLAFGSSIGGHVVLPDAAQRGKHQLYRIESLKGGKDLDPRRKLFIRKEIEPKNFIRSGAKAGFGSYRKTVLAAARTSFTRHRAL